MKAPVQLSREMLEAPRSFRSVVVDEQPFIDTINWAIANKRDEDKHPSAEVPLDEGESVKAIKRRFTTVVRKMDIGKELVWLNLKDQPKDVVRFILIDASTEKPEPKPRKKRSDASASNNGTADNVGATEPVGATA